MSANATIILQCAERLDEFPMELMNGGASAALRALGASAAEAEMAASTRGIDRDTVNELWRRADSRLREIPADDAVVPAAAEAASLLYAAAWVLGSDDVTTDGVRAIL